jgi:hypothetical protein
VQWRSIGLREKLAICEACILHLKSGFGSAESDDVCFISLIGSLIAKLTKMSLLEDVISIYSEVEDEFLNTTESEEVEKQKVYIVLLEELLSLMGEGSEEKSKLRVLNCMWQLVEEVSNKPIFLSLKVERKIQALFKSTYLPRLLNSLYPLVTRYHSRITNSSIPTLI